MNWGFQAQSFDIGDGDNIFGIDRYSTTDYDAMTGLFKTRADLIAANPMDLPSLTEPQGENLARHATAWQTDSNYNSSFGADKAIDGVLSAASKWTSAATAPPHWIALDLGQECRLTGFRIRMAGDAAETVNYDFTTFQVQAGPALTGPWTTDFTVSNPAQFSSQTLLYPSQRQARFVRLYITATGIDNYARLPEFEVYGYAGPTGVSGWILYD